MVEPLGHRGAQAWIKDCQGSVHLLMAGLLLVSVFGGLGTLGLLRQWRGHVETQLRLNRCVGLVAQNFRSLLNLLFSQNREIIRLRKAILAASLQPSLIPPLRAALEMNVAQQEVSLAYWQARRQTWSMMQGCEWGQRDRASPLPLLDLVRLPADLIGAQPLSWVGMPPRSFGFLLRHAPRSAAALVVQENGFGSAEKGIQGTHEWIAVWTEPRKVQGFGL